MTHHKIGLMGGFSAPGRLTPLTFGTGSTRPTGLTFHTIGIPERDVSLRTMSLVTGLGPARHVTFLTCHRFCRFGTV